MTADRPTPDPRESDQTAETAHNPVARYCVVVDVGIPVSELRDNVRCAACDEMSGLVDLDPDFGPASAGRPTIPSVPRCSTCGDVGLVAWLVEADPNLYQEPDDDGMVPCPDCTIPPGSERS